MRMSIFATWHLLKFIFSSLDGIGVVDNIIINHYKLSKQQLENIDEHLANDGILFICGFGHELKANSKIKEQDLIQPTDFKSMKNTFDLIKYNEHQDDRGFFVTYFFRKRKS